MKGLSVCISVLFIIFILLYLKHNQRQIIKTKIQLAKDLSQYQFHRYTDLSSGDVIFEQQSLDKLCTPLHLYGFSHCGIVLRALHNQTLLVAHARFISPSIVMTPIEVFMHPSKVFYVRRISTPLTSGHVTEVFKYVRKKSFNSTYDASIGIEKIQEAVFDPLCLPRIPRLQTYKSRTGVICSEFVLQCLQVVGISAMYHRESYIVPDDLSGLSNDVLNEYCKDVGTSTFSTLARLV